MEKEENFKIKYKDNFTNNNINLELSLLNDKKYIYNYLQMGLNTKLHLN